MTETLKGHFLVPTAKNPDRGLWFIFHHESDGVLAFDLTKAHPDIPYRIFEPLIDHSSAQVEQTILLGGQNQPDSAMLVLYNGAPVEGSHVINAEFAFLSYRCNIVSGRAPEIAKGDGTPSRLAFSPGTDFLIAIGFRVWEMDALEGELRDWQWNFLPAPPEIVFSTPREERLTRAVHLLN